MFCRYCGAKLEEGQMFCSQCGKEMTVEPNYVDYSGSMPDNGMMQNNDAADNMPKKKKGAAGKVVGILIGCLVGLAVIAGAVLFVITNRYNQKRDELKAAIETHQMEGYNTQMERALETWEELSFLDFEGREELLEDLEKISKDAAKDEEELAEWVEELQELEAEKASYNMAQSYPEYEEKLEKCAKAIEKKDIDAIEKAFGKAEETMEIMLGEYEVLVSEKLNGYSHVDMRFAEAKEKEAYEAGMAAIEAMVSEQKYAELAGKLDEMDILTYPYLEPEKSLNIDVQQIDVSQYPKVKLYVEIEDSMTEEIPSNLDQTLFYIGKEDANGEYVKQVISKVNQLNQVEALCIDMVADVSGSMYGEPLDDAKQVMSNFINSVQFAAGDKVELTTFSTGVYIDREFCSDGNLLKQDIAMLDTDDMTSLYDALYTAVTRTAAQTGARCVIAFTDGYDNYSNCDMYDVIEVAQRYRVPIFIIGIGSSDYGDISYIASETGGEYYNIQDVNSMEDIYENIYRQQKELFLIEFTDSSNRSVSETSDIVIRYHSPEYGGESYQSYTPNVLLSVEAEQFYQDGPEAVVEAYMKAFDDAMTYCDFSYIEDYLMPGSPIYQAQEKYVMRNIAESLDSYEIVDVVYSNSDECVVETRETYYVQAENTPLVLLTQNCKYVVVYENGEWQIKDFAESVNVLSSIRQ